MRRVRIIVDFFAKVAIMEGSSREDEFNQILLGPDSAETSVGSRTGTGADAGSGTGDGDNKQDGEAPSTGQSGNAASSAPQTGGKVAGSED
jgi:hypothetical protein